MKANDKIAFAEYMVGIGEIYQQNVSRQKVSLYWQLLANYEWCDVKNAIDAYLVNPDCGQFLPKPADIVNWISGNTVNQALLAWTKVEDAIRKIGPYQSVVFDDAKIHAVLADMGGWIKFETVKHHELPFIAKEFQTRYQQYAIKPPLTYPRKLIGKTECQNALNGYPIPKPMLLGVHDLARKVYMDGGENIKEITSISKLVDEISTQGNDFTDSNCDEGFKAVAV